MQGVHLLPLALLLVLLCYMPPLAASDTIMAWSHDPEWYNEAALWYNEAQLNDNIASPGSRLSTQLKSLAKAILSKYDLSSKPLYLKHPIIVSSSYSESPEWFLVHDPEFFNENLVFPTMAQQQLTPIKSHFENVGLSRAQLKHITPERSVARRLLKPHKPNARKLMRNSSLAKKFYEWVITTIESWRTSANNE